MLEKLKGALARHPRLFDVALKAMPARSDAERFFESLGDGISFIQIGANDGLRWDPLRRSIVRNRWTGIAIEPLPSVFPLLKRNYAHVHGVQCEQLAVGAKDEMLTFWTMSDGFLDGLHADVQLYYNRKSSFHRAAVEKALTSFDDEQLEYLSKRGHSPVGINVPEAISSVQVECLSVNTLVRRYRNGKSPDLLSIDAEGHEATIIPAIDFETVRPRALFYEACHLGAEDAARITAHLKSAGYSITPMGADSVALLA